MRPSGFDAHIDMEPALAGCFGPTDQAKRLQYSLADLRDLPHLWPFDAGDWIKVDAQFIGMFKVVRAHRMGMQFEAAQISHPYQRCGIARHDFFRAAAGWKFYFDHFDPIRPG